MSKKDYIKDKLFLLIIAGISYGICLLVLFAFKVNSQAIIAITIIYLTTIIFSLTFDYARKKLFYRELKNKLDNLDQKYLVIEMLSSPCFLEGKIMFDSLYEINKSMIEKIKEYKSQTQNFKEYVELWIHEVKLPVSSLVLMIHNHKNEYNKKILEQLTRLDNYLEQILYYVRSENAEKDYLISKVNLAKVISNIALKNKDTLLEKKIDFIASDIDIDIYTDAKWLEFIINQIIDNSIKYSNKKKPYIKILAKEEKNYIACVIYDNGVGISKEDLPRVFEKTYTGKNGRIGKQSTGMGLYIVKRLCDKLGHNISINSIEREFTCVKIKFAKNDYYQVKD